MSLVKVLVVDDEPGVVELVEKLLQLKGNYQVSSASNGKEALELVKTDRPDLILLDVVMPEMDGPTVVEKLGQKEATADIPIIFLTGLVETDPDKHATPELGGQLYLPKPFDADELFARIATALESTL